METRTNEASLLTDVELKEFIRRFVPKSDYTKRYLATYPVDPEHVLSVLQANNIIDTCRSAFMMGLVCEYLLLDYEVVFRSCIKPVQLLERLLHTLCASYLRQHEIVYNLQNSHHRYDRNILKPEHLTTDRQFVYCDAELAYIEYFAFHCIKNNSVSNKTDTANDYLHMIGLDQFQAEIKKGATHVGLLAYDIEHEIYYFRDVLFMQYMAARFVTGYMLGRYYEGQTSYYLGSLGVCHKVTAFTENLKGQIDSLLKADSREKNHLAMMNFILKLLTDLDQRIVWEQYNKSSIIHSNQFFHKNDYLGKTLSTMKYIPELKFYLENINNTVLHIIPLTPEDKNVKNFMYALFGKLDNMSYAKNVQIFTLEIEEEIFIIKSQSCYAISKMDKALRKGLGEMLVSKSTIMPACM